MLLVKKHIERDGSGFVTLRRQSSSSSRNLIAPPPSPSPLARDTGRCETIEHGQA